MQFFNRFISAATYNAKVRLMRILLENYYEHTDSSRSLCPIQPLPSPFFTRETCISLSQGLHSSGCDLLIHNQKWRKFRLLGWRRFFFRYIFYQYDCMEESLIDKMAVERRLETIKI